jgi:hypothetical protein
MNRRTAAILILVIWAGAVGWLIQHQNIRTDSQLLADAVFRISPGATYYSLDLSGQQVGFASSSVDTIADTVQVRDYMLLEIPALGSIQRVEARTDANLTRSLQLREFEAGLRGDGVRFGASGLVSGDTLLSVEIESADSRQTVRVPLDEPVLLPALLPLHIVFGSEPAVGNEYRLKLFDPLLLNERYVSVTVEAESTLLVPDSAAWDSTSSLWVAARWDTLQAWRIVQNVGGLSVRSWIDELGQVVEATSPVGFTMQRTAFEIASLNFQRRETNAAELAAGLGGDIIRQTAIASNVPLQTDDLQQLKVRLGGLDFEDFDLSGGRQSVVGDTLVVVRETDEELTHDPERFTAERMQELSEWIGPEPLVQTRDPRIQAQARQITERFLSGRRRNYVRAAEALNEWVNENLDKQITVSVPSAVEVLETRRGDCNEHTVLYVALARSVGIPARTAAGLVYSDGSFFYHAWPEIYLNGWVAVDPTFGQFPADAAHLRFTIGGLARQMELVRLIGRLQLDVLDTEN